MTTNFWYLDYWKGDGINERQIGHYTSGHRTPRPQQREKIITGIVYQQDRILQLWFDIGTVRVFIKFNLILQIVDFLTINHILDFIKGKNTLMY